jgi:sugar fermentation stimulation protein A
LNLKKGFYIYCGSAGTNLKARLNRHGRRRKKTHWHIDYIVPAKMKTLKVFPIRRTDDVEEALAGDLLKIGDGFVDGFGSGDSRQPSHLVHFSANPLRMRTFFNVLLDYRMFVK